MYIGIDIGGTGIKGILADSSGEILAYRDVPTPCTAREIDLALANMADDLPSIAGINNRNLRAIGIGSAGSLDRQKGRVLFSANILCLKNHPLANNVTKLTGLPVALDNDATSALMGVWWKGGGAKYKHWILLTLGTGIGGGAILDGKLYGGMSGNAMEVGHTTIDYNGPPCSCGNRGCFERYASVTALMNLAMVKMKKDRSSSLHSYDKSTITARDIHREAVKGDPLALSVFRETAEFLGIGIANLISIFNPEAVFLGGGLSNAHKLLIPAIKSVVKERVQPGLREKMVFIPVKNQERMAALGAAKIAMDRYS